MQAEVNTARSHKVRPHILSGVEFENDKNKMIKNLVLCLLIDAACTLYNVKLDAVKKLDSDK